jgi:hypothetical protein
MTDTPPTSGQTPWFPQAAQPPFWPSAAAQPGYAASGYGAPRFGPPGYTAPGYTAPGYGQPLGQQRGWGPGVPPAPGGVPLRPLGVGDILSGAFSLIRQNPAATMGLTASIVTTVSVVMVAIFVIAGRTTAAVGLLAVPAGLAFLALQLGGLVAAMGRSLLGRKLTMAEAARRSRAGWVLLATLLLAGLFSAFWVPLIIAAKGWGLLLALPLTAWLGVMLSLTIPVIVLERRGPIAALGRSVHLIRGSYWRVLGIYFLTYLMTWVLSLVISLPLGFVGGLADALGPGGGGTPPVAVAILVIGEIAIASLVTTIDSGVLVLVYADMRMRKEGMDLVLRQAAADRQLTGEEFASTGLTSAYTGGAGPGFGFQASYQGGFQGGFQASYQGGETAGDQGGGQGGEAAGGYPASPPVS